MKALFVIFVFVIVLIENGLCVMTDSQIKSAAKLMRNVCQPKSKVTSVDIDTMHKGEFTEDHAMMCYMECILRMGQIMKDGKLNLESARTQIASLPPDLAQSATGALDSCKDAIKSSEKCRSAYEFYKCYYEFSPANFFLP